MSFILFSLIIFHFSKFKIMMRNRFLQNNDMPKRARSQMEKKESSYKTHRSALYSSTLRKGCVIQNKNVAFIVITSVIENGRFPSHQACKYQKFECNTHHCSGEQFVLSTALATFPEKYHNIYTITQRLDSYIYSLVCGW